MDKIGKPVCRPERRRRTRKYPVKISSKAVWQISRKDAMILAGEQY
jgi:hypothetical protein